MLLINADFLLFSDTYVSSLRNLHDSGNASYFEIPVDLLRLDNCRY